MSATLPGPAPVGYPDELSSDVLLADGRVAELRPIVPGDAELLAAFVAKLSDETRYLRFFSYRRALSDDELHHLVSVDYLDRLALVALVEGELAAVARYERITGTDEAEVAFTVRDDQQGRGLGTVLLEHLASAAEARGVRRFVADTLSENHKMLKVFRTAGFEERARFDSGVVRVTLLLEPVADYLEKVEDRDRRAAVRSIERLLEPRSVAVIGASPRPATIGHELLSNLVAAGFPGPIFPVHPTAAEVLGLRAYDSVEAIGQPVDLAVIAVPAEAVAEVVEECGRAGVGGLVIVSAGFAETGEDGAATERRILAIARHHGMRVVGPNCMGVINTSPTVRLNGTFAPVAPVPGRVAFSSQSGGLGIAILGEAARRGLGISSFVSIGNKVDVSGNDLIRYWDADPGTDVILLYLESFGNPRHFSRIARRVAHRKPIVAVKSGRSSAGSRGASSHTAALASPDAAVDALFRMAGVIRVDTLEELFDVAEVVAHQPLPRGARVAIVGNAGGPGVLAADACEGYGLTVPELSEATQAQLRAVLSPGAGVRNPVDCIASATAEEYRKALEIVLADDAVDAVIVIFTPPLVTEPKDVAAAVAEVAATATKPIVANFLSAGGSLDPLRSGPRPVPWFAYPESAARALARVVPYAIWRGEPEQQPPELDDLDPARGRRVVLGALARGDGSGEGGWLGPVEAAALLEAYGIPVLASKRVSTGEEAVAAASSFGYPVALKIDAAGVVHKSDIGGVRLDLERAEEVSRGAEELLQLVPGAGLLVQPMVAPGPETIVGLVEDPSFGPLVLFGLGGTATEILGDRALSLVPLTKSDAYAMIRSLKSAPLLDGYRGAPRADLDALADVLCRVARLAEDLPEVVELDLNPVVSSASGCAVLDAKVRVRSVAPEPVLRRRQLR